VRTIQISTEVFARIWAQRITGEEDENAILTRLLGVKEVATANEDRKTRRPAELSFIPAALWRQDVRDGLRLLGGSGHLKEIYEAVRSIRRKHGRSVPQNLEAVVRRELEYNSSDASVFQGKRDWFRSVEGIGSGLWALRDEQIT
jgi:hypothetical protein